MLCASGYFGFALRFRSFTPAAQVQQILEQQRIKRAQGREVGIVELRGHNGPQLLDGHRVICCPPGNGQPGGVGRLEQRFGSGPHLLVPGNRDALPPRTKVGNGQLERNKETVADFRPWEEPGARIWMGISTRQGARVGTAVGEVLGGG